MHILFRWLGEDILYNSTQWTTWGAVSLSSYDIITLMTKWMIRLRDLHPQNVVYLACIWTRRLYWTPPKLLWCAALFDICYILYYNIYNVFKYIKQNVHIYIFQTHVFMTNDSNSHLWSPMSDLSDVWPRKCYPKMYRIVYDLPWITFRVAGQTPQVRDTYFFIGMSMQRKRVFMSKQGLQTGNKQHIEPRTRRDRSKTTHSNAFSYREFLYSDSHSTAL